MRNDGQSFGWRLREVLLTKCKNTHEALSVIADTRSTSSKGESTRILFAVVRCTWSRQYSMSMQLFTSASGPVSLWNYSFYFFVHWRTGSDFYSSLNCRCSQKVVQGPRTTCQRFTNANRLCFKFVSTTQQIPRSSFHSNFLPMVVLISAYMSRLINDVVHCVVMHVPSVVTIVTINACPYVISKRFLITFQLMCHRSS